LDRDEAAAADADVDSADDEQKPATPASSKKARKKKPLQLPSPQPQPQQRNKASDQELFLAGVRHFQHAKVDDAIRCFSQVLELDAGAIDALFYRGACHYHRKDALKTIADFEKLTRLAPTKAAYWSCLGDAYMNLTDELDEALRCYTRCVDVDSTFAAAHYNRGMCRYKMKQYDPALLDVERALSIEPHNSNYINGAREMREKLARFRAQAAADDDGLDGLGDEDPADRRAGGDDDDDDDADVLQPKSAAAAKRAAASADAELDAAFARAVKRVGESKAPISVDEKLRIYALFKQASQGKCTLAQPSLINVTERAKWNAWHELGDMPKEKARALYVELADSLIGARAAAASAAAAAAESANAPSKSSGAGAGMGSNSVSRPVATPAAPADDKDVCFYASVGDKQHVLQLLESGAFHVDHGDDERRTPLIFAADRNDAELCTALLKRGADVNAQDIDGQTALHYAALCGHIEIVRILLAADNIDRTLCDNDGQSAYDVAEGAVKALLF
jgi:acyl-CoA-binding protein/regulator of sirC expression with transglutaminase-like and TPR domain